MENLDLSERSNIYLLKRRQDIKVAFMQLTEQLLARIDDLDREGYEHLQTEYVETLQETPRRLRLASLHALGSQLERALEEEISSDLKSAVLLARKQVATLDTVAITWLTNNTRDELARLEE